MGPVTHTPSPCCHWPASSPVAVTEGLRGQSTQSIASETPLLPHLCSPGLGRFASDCFCTVPSCWNCRSLTTSRPDYPAVRDWMLFHPSTTTFCHFSCAQANANPRGWFVALLVRTCRTRRRTKSLFHNVTHRSDSHGKTPHAQLHISPGCSGSDIMTDDVLFSPRLRSMLHLNGAN